MPRQKNSRLKTTGHVLRWTRPTTRRPTADGGGPDVGAAAVPVAAEEAAVGGAELGIVGRSMPPHVFR